ncbi:MAG: Fe-S-containing hydro-lyase [Anaerolineae bacterium]|nr:Fe-S-containing hydro-lyase [Anaerolineae bacterium]
MTAQPKQINTPLTDDTIQSLHVGDRVLISGTIYTARDAAHKRLCAALEAGDDLPFSLEGQIIYYVGPSPTRPDQIIGSAGPTTSSRVDPYTPALIQQGLKGMIGKGKRNQAVRDALAQHHAVYFATVGGAAALIAECVKAVEMVAYEDLKTEAIRKLTIENFPVVVANDIYGADLYEQGRLAYRRQEG